MSILLDALKKSETQRQLGKTPTIHTAVEAPDAKRETEQQWIPLSMLALSAVAIAWFGWQQFLEPVETDGVDAAVMPLVEETPVSETQVPAEKTEKGGMNRTLPASPPNANKDLAQSTTLPANVSENTRERKEKLSQSFNSYEAEKDTATDTSSRISPDDRREGSIKPGPGSSGHKSGAGRGGSTGRNSEQAHFPFATTRVRADQFLANSPGFARWFAGIQDQRACLRGETGRPLLADQRPEAGGKGRTR